MTRYSTVDMSDDDSDEPVKYLFDNLLFHRRHADGSFKRQKI